MSLLAILNRFVFMVFKIGNGWLEKNYAFNMYFITGYLTNSPTTSNSLAGLYFFGSSYQNIYNSLKRFSFPYFNSVAETNRTMVLKNMVTAGIFSYT